MKKWFCDAEISSRIGDAGGGACSTEEDLLKLQNNLHKITKGWMTDFFSELNIQMRTTMSCCVVSKDFALPEYVEVYIDGLDETPLLMRWRYVFLALTRRYSVWRWTSLDITYCGVQRVEILLTNIKLFMMSGDQHLHQVTYPSS